MKREQFAESQIVSALKQQEGGIPVKDIARDPGISEATFYNWKSKYGAMEASNDVFNRSSTTYSARIFPLAHGEDREERDFQDDQPPTSIGDQGLNLLAVHQVQLDSADQRNVHLRMIQNLPLLHDIVFLVHHVFLE